MTNAIITKTYNGNETALQFREDGWFNMTKAANAFGKRLQNFMDNKETKDYMAALTHSISGELTEAKMGRYHGGTWAHPKLAVFFARWLDTKFAVWCDTVIDDILRGNAEVVVTKPEQSEAMKTPTSLLEAAHLWLQELKRAEELKEQAKVLEHGSDHFTIHELQTTAVGQSSPSQRGKLD